MLYRSLFHIAPRTHDVFFLLFFFSFPTNSYTFDLETISRLMVFELLPFHRARALHSLAHRTKMCAYTYNTHHDDLHVNIRIRK